MSFERLSTGRLQGRSSSTLHSQLSDIMREKIYSRAWGAGKKIPSEHELMKTFGL